MLFLQFYLKEKRKALVFFINMQEETFETIKEKFNKIIDFLVKYNADRELIKWFKEYVTMVLYTYKRIEHGK